MYSDAVYVDKGRYKHTKITKVSILVWVCLKGMLKEKSTKEK